MPQNRADYQSIPELRTQTRFPAFKVEGERPRGSIERFLSIFADVRAGEGLAALLLMFNVLLLLGSYYLLKTAREPLILTEGGSSVKSYSSAAQAVLLMAVVPLYSFVSARVNRLKLVVGLTLFFASHLLAFQALGFGGVRIGVAFYIWVGIFNLFVVSQFWSFANDLYTESQGKRLFPMIGIGASVGAVAGAQVAGWLFKTFQLSPYSLMNIAAGVLALCAALVYAANRVETSRGEQVMNRHANQAIKGENGFRLVFASRYLRWIALLIVLLNVVNTTGEFLLGSMVEREAQRLHSGDQASMRTYIGAFYGEYFFWVNLLGLLVQSLAVSRIFDTIGVRGALLILPCLALSSYSAMAMAPLLGVIRWAKTLENAIDYSLQNTVRQALFLPASRAEKYKAKAAIDTFFVRFGDVLQAGIVKVGGELAIGFAGFAWLNVALTVTWLWVASQLAREHRRMGF
jgi:ATP:ADP antiporter, AAA family